MSFELPIPFQGWDCLNDVSAARKSPVFSVNSLEEDELIPFIAGVLSLDFFTTQNSLLKTQNFFVRPKE